MTASITKIDENLISRLAAIVEVICWNFPIDADKFGEYAKETADLAVSLYPWYCMPSTVHKILIHGKQIVECAAFPIGALSEEAQESKNEDYKTYTLNHGRKCSRTATYICNMFLISSDP